MHPIADLISRLKEIADDYFQDDVGSGESDVSLALYTVKRIGTQLCAKQKSLPGRSPYDLVTTQDLKGANHSHAVDGSDSEHPLLIGLCVMHSLMQLEPDKFAMPNINSVHMRPLEEFLRRAKEYLLANQESDWLPLGSPSSFLNSPASFMPRNRDLIEGGSPDLENAVELFPFILIDDLINDRDVALSLMQTHGEKIVSRIMSKTNVYEQELEETMLAAGDNLFIRRQLSLLLEEGGRAWNSLTSRDRIALAMIVELSGMNVCQWKSLFLQGPRGPEPTYPGDVFTFPAALKSQLIAIGIGLALLLDDQSALSVLTDAIKGLASEDECALDDKELEDLKEGDERFRKCRRDLNWELVNRRKIEFALRLYRVLSDEHNSVSENRGFDLENLSLDADAEPDSELQRPSIGAVRKNDKEFSEFFTDDGWGKSWHPDQIKFLKEIIDADGEFKNTTQIFGGTSKKPSRWKWDPKIQQHVEKGGGSRGFRWHPNSKDNPNPIDYSKKS